MGEAVGIFYEDDFTMIDPALRSILEQMLPLQMISEAELNQDEPHSKAALIFVEESGIAFALVRIAALKARLPSLRIVVVVQAMSAANLLQLVEAGADSFVARRPSSHELSAALTPSPRAESMRSKAAASTSVTTEELSLGLTPRETEILRLLSSGFSNKDVARRLDLSVRTVETHRFNLRRKTQAGRLKDLVTLARTHGLDPVLDLSPSAGRRFAQRVTPLASKDCSALP